MPAQRTVLELCAGGGGQAIGLEHAGFHHTAAVDIAESCAQTLRLNRPRWRVLTQDIRELDGHDFRGVDLVAGGFRARRSPLRASSSAATTNGICSPGHFGS